MPRDFFAIEVSHCRFLFDLHQNPNGFKPETLRLVKDEREIFDLLGFPYVRSAFSLLKRMLNASIPQLTPEERDYAVWRRRYERAGERESRSRSYCFLLTTK